jgi:hypothetical protein
LFDALCAILGNDGGIPLFSEHGVQDQGIGVIVFNDENDVI